jgi:hypothetical protein
MKGRGGEQKEDELEILGMTYGGYIKKPSLYSAEKMHTNLYFIWVHSANIMTYFIVQAR